MLELARIKGTTSPFFDDAWALFLEAFPLSEQRSYEEHIRAMQNEKFHCMAYIENEKVQAIMFYWNLENFIFIEYFAIDSKNRGKGLGTKILEDFALSAQKILLLEIEEIIDEKTLKRWNFYEKLGFEKYEKIYMHPPYRKDFPSFALHILTYKHELTESEYNLFTDIERKIVFEYIYKEKVIY